EGSKQNPKKMIVNKWRNEKLLSQDEGGKEEQWFSFIATASTQYVYVKFSTLGVLRVSLYDKDLNMIGTSVKMYGASGDVVDFSRQVNIDELYYIKTERDSRNGYSDTGAYWMGVTDFPMRPEKEIVALNVDTWVNSKIDPYSGGDSYDWYSFIATNSTQNVQVKFSTLEVLRVSLYDKDLNMIGTSVKMYGVSGDVVDFSRQVNIDELYYIKTERDSRNGYSDTGSYWLAFN
ncbi:MAG: hypothetical protein J6C25_06955, partial [Treponema sp.]|nr:hypothetical protein [Treponema sp.]